MSTLELIKSHVSRLPNQKQGEVLDFVLFLESHQATARKTPASKKQETRKRLQLAFNTLIASGTFAKIDKPVEWQKKAREDRPCRGDIYASGSGAVADGGNSKKVGRRAIITMFA